MINIFDVFYDVSVKDLVDALAVLFNISGMDIKGDEYFIRCPFHKHGKERTASASFKMKSEKPEEIGMFNCFGCGASGYISKILVKLFGSRQKAEHWVSSSYKTIEQEENRTVNKIEFKGPQVKQEYDLPLSLFTNSTPYFKQRGIPEDLVRKFRLGYSPAKEAVIFPVFDEVGSLVFYQVRYISKNSKYKWFIPKDAEVKIFGKQHMTSRICYVCESVFNALTLWKFGFEAVATFGARADQETVEQLLELPCLKFIIAYDGDEAGIKKAKRLAKTLKASNRLVSVLDINEKGKDINDFAFLSKEAFNEKMDIWAHNLTNKEI